MNLQKEYKVYHVRSGQPRAYADTEYVTRVECIVHNFKGETSAWEPADFVSPGPSKDEQISRFVDVALRILGYENAKWRNEVSYSKNAAEFFRGYVDYAKYVGDGIVEVRYVRPFTD